MNSTPAPLYPINTTFVAFTGDTRYKVIYRKADPMGRSDRIGLEVSLKMNDGTWRVSNPRSMDRALRIAGLVEEGRWVQLDACGFPKGESGL